MVTDQTKEIDRLTEENNNLKTINKGHKDLNGELQTKLSKKEQEVVALYENVKLKDKIISRLKDRIQDIIKQLVQLCSCLLYTSPSPRDLSTSRMPSSA